MEAKILSVPNFTPSDIDEPRRKVEGELLFGSIENLGTIASKEPAFDRLNARTGVELLSAPRITAPETKWRWMPKIVRSSHVDSVQASETFGLVEMIGREFGMSEFPKAVIFDARPVLPFYTNSENGEVAILQPPLLRGLAFANEIAAQDDGQLDVAFYFREARLKPNAPDIYPNEAAARDALNVRTFGYRYTCRDGETAIFRLPADETGNDLLIFVTVEEILYPS